MQRTLYNPRKTPRLHTEGNHVLSRSQSANQCLFKDKIVDYRKNNTAQSLNPFKKRLSLMKSHCDSSLSHQYSVPKIANSSSQQLRKNSIFWKDLKRRKTMLEQSESSSSALIKANQQHPNEFQRKYRLTEPRKKVRRVQIQNASQQASQIIFDKEIEDKETMFAELTQVEVQSANGIFANSREGAALTGSGRKEIYLVGGDAVGGINEYTCIHALSVEEAAIQSTTSFDAKFKKPVWRALKWNCKRQKSPLSLSFHTCEMFRNYLMLIGGISLRIGGTKRLYHSQISLFSNQTHQWQRIKWNVCVRSHGSAIYNQMLLIYGGINQKDILSDVLHLVCLNPNDMSSSAVLTLPAGLGHEDASEKDYRISGNKMISTEFSDRLKLKLYIQGIISFGGRMVNGTFSNELRVIRIMSIGDSFDTYNKESYSELIRKGWQTIHIKGPVPRGRTNHSFNLVASRGIALVFGGITTDHEVLGDLWLLNLIDPSWKSISMHTMPAVIHNGVHSHSVCVEDDRVFCFGGINSDFKYVSFFGEIKISAHQKKKGAKSTIYKQRQYFIN